MPAPGRSDAPAGSGRRRRPVIAAGALILPLLATACASRALTLPSGPSTPLTDPTILTNALAHCTEPGTLAAEIGLSGRAAGQRIRGTLHAGFAPPDRLRLEAVAPFGGPIFLLAGGGGRATLLLPREDRVLRDAAPGDILQSLAGLDVAPADLAAWIAGCPAAPLGIGDPRQYGAEWIAGALDGGRRVWLSREDDWRLVALTAGPLTVEFDEHQSSQPGRIRIRRPEGADGPAIDLGLTVRQVERGIALGDQAFTLDVPANATPISLDDLRQSGPLRDRQ